jgi:hypothetical protein
VEKAEQLYRLLRSVLAEIKDSPLDDNTVRDFVFHLTECTDELKELVGLLLEPDRYDVQGAKRIVQAVLYHSSGHIAQAARLYDYFPDQFGRGDKSGTRSGTEPA